MSAPLLFQMFKSKTGFPLHAAVRLQREDVVFLYLVENNGDVSINEFIPFLLLVFNEQYVYILLQKFIICMKISGFIVCLYFIL
jgi:hypothetical protein